MKNVWTAAVLGVAALVVTGVVAVQLAESPPAPGNHLADGVNDNISPDQPILVGPPDGAPQVSQPTELTVSVSDPDGDPLDVTFHGRPVGAGAEPFAIAVLPDTQFYSQSYPQTYLAQTDWIVANRDALGIEFALHLGDLVNVRSVRDQWLVADAAQATFDSAGLPYAVVPGNHDITLSGEAPWYDRYFPPSRFAGQPWYLGYLGDSLSGSTEGTGADDVDDAGLDRLNKNSYQVLDTGNVRLVFIGLEQGMPGYAVAWAQRVIDAELAVDPDTEFVVVTHNFLDVDGTRPTIALLRPDGTSAEQVWNTLIRPNCSIHLVLNGHYHSEAQRTDLNACGEPVHQLLSDYQARDNGGDGWLRYLTFRPGADAIDVVTYSPTLDQYETDSDSQFSLEFELSDEAGFAELGTVENVESGANASVTLPGLVAGTTYEWYAVVTDGTRTTTGPRWRFTAAP